MSVWTTIFITEQKIRAQLEGQTADMAVYVFAYALLTRENRPINVCFLFQNAIFRFDRLRSLHERDYFLEWRRKLAAKRFESEC